MRVASSVTAARCSAARTADSVSFLTRIKQTLAQASTLIGTCESAGRSVDEALAIVEDTLAKFRQAIAGLAEATVDITLIGMNAGLKASHLGSRGSAFVVIANELKATADQVSAGAGRLRPVLDGIERSANELRELRVQGDPTQLAKLEPQILQALREVEAGNERLGKLMSRLVDEGAEFEGLMNSAQGLMSSLGESSATLAYRRSAPGDRERGHASAAAEPGRGAARRSLRALHDGARARRSPGIFASPRACRRSPPPAGSRRSSLRMTASNCFDVAAGVAHAARQFDELVFRALTVAEYPPFGHCRAPELVANTVEYYDGNFPC